MPADRRLSPPRLALRLVDLRLPADLAESVAGDLEEEYRSRAVPSWGRVVADLWFWGQVLALRTGAVRREHRRLESTRPAWRGEGPQPLHAKGHGPTAAPRLPPWVHLRHGPDDPAWLVLDPAGEPIGTIHVSPASSISAADRTAVWTAEADADGVQSVVRYRVAGAERPPIPHLPD